jgi:hypothetical protein
MLFNIHIGQAKCCRINGAVGPTRSDATWAVDAFAQYFSKNGCRPKHPGLGGILLKLRHHFRSAIGDLHCAMNVKALEWERAQHTRDHVAHTISKEPLSIGLFADRGRHKVRTSRIPTCFYHIVHANMVDNIVVTKQSRTGLGGYDKHRAVWVTNGIARRLMETLGQ